MTSDARKRQAEKVSHNHGIDPSCGEHPVGACLVTIDPDDRAQIERLLELENQAVEEIREAQGGGGVLIADALQVAFKRLNDPSIRFAIKEPTGLGAVVEDNRGDLWVRVKGDSWACGLSRREWVDIDATRVLSDGVKP